MGLEKYVEVTVPSKKLPAARRKEIFEAKRDLEALQRYRSDQADRALNRLLALATLAQREGYELTQIGHGLSDAPRTTTASVRALADEVGFLVMPFEYLDIGRFGPNNRAVSALHQRYGSQMYVMAPVNAYNLQRQLDGRDLPMHVPADAAQAFMALQMSVPVLRSMQAQLAALENQVRGIYEQQRSMRAQIQALHQRVDALGLAMAADRAQRVATEAAERTRRTASYSQWYQRGGDPLVIVLPEERKTIADETWALVGPSWGTLPKELEDALKQARAKTRRARR